MVSNRLAFAALATACIGAAAGGGYLATRQNIIPAATSAAEVAVPPAADLPGAATATATTALPTDTAPAGATDRKPGAAVRETEGVVGDASVKLPPPAASSTGKRADAPDTRSRRPAAPVGKVARQEPPPTLTSSWPSSASSSQPPAPIAPPDLPAVTPRPDDPRGGADTARAQEPPQKTFEELVVSAESVIGLQTENRITSETARVEDRVEARVTRDVKVGDRVAIPAGTRALGSVMQVDRGGKFKERARLGIRFHTLVLADGTRLQISTETIYREGEAPGNGTAAKVGGGAVGGAILGAILGGAKGAAIGASAGAGAGTAAVMAGDRNVATFPSGTPMTVRILTPVTVTSEK
jgi:hypothetical protein